MQIADAALVAAATLSDRYITARFLPDKAIDLVDEAASRLRMEIDSRPVEIDELQRAVDRLKMEELALDQGDRRGLAASGWSSCARDLADKQEELRGADRPLGAGEGRASTGSASSRSSSTTLRGQAERAQRDGDLETASRLLYGRDPGRWRRELAEAAPRPSRDAARPMVKEEVGPDDIAEVVAAWTGIPAGRLLEGETAKLLRMEEELGRRLIGQTRGRARGVRRRTPRPRRHLRPRPADRLVPVPRPDRRRQDRAGQGARRLPVRRRAGDGPHRHERVRREALASPGWSAPRPATSATRRAASSPRRCAAGRTPWCCSTRSRRRTPRSSTSCCRCSTTAGSPTARAARSTSATRS